MPSNCKVDTLTDEHRDRVWMDRDGDVWVWRGDDWMSWEPGQWEARNYMDPEGYGPFTELRKADHAE